MKSVIDGVDQPGLSRLADPLEVSGSKPRVHHNEARESLLVLSSLLDLGGGRLIDARSGDRERGVGWASLESGRAVLVGERAGVDQ
jgi:hypothetical protein